MISRREWLIAWSLALATAMLMQLPYVLGYALAQSGTVFTGILMNPEDSSSYFAKMLQGYDGAWLYSIPFTSEMHASAFVGGFYLILGHVARILGLALEAMWHVARLVCDVILFLFTFVFIARFVFDASTRWMAFVLALFGSGLGWVLLLLNQTNWLGWFPVDFKMPEAHLFFTALTFPHVAFGAAMTLASFWFALNALESPRARWHVLGAALANLLIAIAYPFLIYLNVTVLGLFWLWRTVCAKKILVREAFMFAAMFVFATPLVVYYAVTLATNPVFRAWDAQAITPSPPLPHYLIAYGVMIFFALASLRRYQNSQAFLWAWLIAVALLVYAPLNPQRRFVQGVQVPLAMLGAVGWQAVALPWLAQTRVWQSLVAHPRYSTPGLMRLLTIAFLGVMMLSNLYVLASMSATAAIEQPFPFFQSREQINALTWLRTNTSRADAVVSLYETGSLIASRAGNRVWIGHWAETLDWNRKMLEVNRFYQHDTEDAWRRDWLARNDLVLIWWGPQEHAASTFDPTRANFLEPIYSNTHVTILQVRR